MMQDDLLVGRYHRYLDRLVELSHREIERTQRHDARFTDVARFYAHECSDIRRIFREVYGSDIVRAFRKHRDLGKLEIITCGATHGFLPLLDAHPQPRAGAHAPVATPGGVVFFARDMESSRQVWSSESGYPGDNDYREFYKDVGWELPADYLADFLPDGVRKNLGLKYYRITGKVGLGDKQPYVRAWALEKAASHALNFLQNRQKQVEHLAGGLDRRPVVVSPYDAELFGHWWFEGPDFLNFLFRKMHHDQDVVKAVTPLEYLELEPQLDVVQPPFCTWGAQGYGEVWLNPGNDWIYPHLDVAAERMVELARGYEHPDPRERRALNQAARELLLAQASDWAFIMKTNTTVEYAKKKTRDHIARFDYLYRALTHQCMLEEPILREFEGRDNIFPEIDYRVYA